MAVVNITEKLNINILETASWPFAERYKQAATLSLDDSRLVYDKHFIEPSIIEALEKVPKHWVSLSHSPSFKDHLYLMNKSDTHWVKLQFIPQPLYYSYSWTYTPSNPAKKIEGSRQGWQKTDLESDPIFAPYLAKLNAIIKERDEILQTIEKMLKACKTINQVEKIWPAIRKYLPEEAVERLIRKPEKKTVESIGIDKDELNKLSVAHIRQQMTS
jgi:hypothetical protein